MNNILTVAASIVGTILLAFGNSWGLIGLVPALIYLIKSDVWEGTK